MKKRYIFFIFFLFTLATYAQDLYLIKLKTKDNSSTELSNPLKFLSQRSLDRRIKYSITLDEKDIPISSDRISQIKKLSLNYIGHSKWLNTIMVEISDSSVISKIKDLSFVESVNTMVRNTNSSDLKKREPKWIDLNAKSTNYNYGVNNFIEQINLKPLHNQGYLGENIYIGVIDAGFPGVDKITAFKNLRSDNRILDTYDFVEKNKNVYNSNSHGTMVLSTMAAEVDGTYVGTAPKANYSLYISEDNNNETPKELLYWIQAAERADSVGVDIINTSLGYTTFDDSRYDYSYQDMNGTTTLIALGAKVAIDKGILVVVAAGNEGSKSWKYITSPADVENAFTVGANTSNNYAASFSSYGPNSLGILKPNVSALGQYIYLYSDNGQIIFNNGTSFSSPITAGAMAIMLQKFPKTPLALLKSKVEESASLYSSPSNQLGYGIPDYYKASQEVLMTNDFKKESEFLVFPNPFGNEITVQSKNGVNFIEIYSLIGQKILSFYNQEKINTSNLKSGFYLIKIQDKKGNFYMNKLLKK
ncbi:S8 family serine peptidase [Chishuiella sp.]|uniref:S8 family serine peptidase n=1 Tax=Chishuiella sp. TaxID=1969467 RepID=UPI0028AF5980|nr:S8 family serine peptidase [Chishuiella sp.]